MSEQNQLGTPRKNAKRSLYISALLLFSGLLAGCDDAGALGDGREVSEVRDSVAQELRSPDEGKQSETVSALPVYADAAPGEEAGREGFEKAKGQFVDLPEGIRECRIIRVSGYYGGGGRYVPWLSMRAYLGLLAQRSDVRFQLEQYRDAELYGFRVKRTNEPSLAFYFKEELGECYLTVFDGVNATVERLSLADQDYLFDVLAGYVGLTLDQPG